MAVKRSSLPILFNSIRFAAQTEKPRPEDVECLSKLMTTVGNLLDHSSRMQKFHTAQGQEKMVSSKELMDVRRRTGLNKRSALIEVSGIPEFILFHFLLKLFVCRCTSKESPCYLKIRHWTPGIALCYKI